jgi:hypothetical protein
METILIMALGCLGQACCWYRVFQCCGCIGERRAHVQIEKQAVVQPVVPTQSPNPFLNPGMAKEYVQSAYKL